MKYVGHVLSMWKIKTTAFSIGEVSHDVDVRIVNCTQLLKKCPAFYGTPRSSLPC
jgi:hypothetical protein